MKLYDIELALLALLEHDLMSHCMDFNMSNKGKRKGGGCGRGGGGGRKEDCT